LTKASLGIIGLFRHLALPSLGNAREEAIVSPWASRRRRSAWPHRGPADSCSCACMTRPSACHPPTLLSRQYRVLKRAASPTHFRCRPAALSRRSCRPALRAGHHSVYRTHSARLVLGEGSVAHVSEAHRSRRAAAFSSTLPPSSGMRFARGGTTSAWTGRHFSTYAESMTYKQSAFCDRHDPNARRQNSPEAEICVHGGDGEGFRLLHPDLTR